MSILERLFAKPESRTALRPLYDAIVREARRPVWYREGGAADTLDGRFEMVAVMLSLVLIRLESEGDEGKAPSVHLTEIFVDDMDGQLREIGIGDIVVGKHIGRMMSALGGRLGAYRTAFADSEGDAAQEAALTRNLYRGEPPAPQAMTVMRAGLRALIGEMARAPLESLLKGRLAP